MARRTMWVRGCVVAAAVSSVGVASAKKPDPASEGELAACVELSRERLWSLAANNESQVSAELSAPTPADTKRTMGIALASRRGPSGTELIYTSYQVAARVGGAGTFGPWPVKVAALRRGYAVLTVAASLSEVEAQRQKDRVVWLDAFTPPDELLPGAPPLEAAGTQLSRELTVAAVEAMNKQGGLPWLSWAAGGRRTFKRVKVTPTEDGTSWNPVKGADSAMHPLFVWALDLEGNGTPYLFIAYNDSPVSDTTEVWRPNAKGKWKKLGEASGNLAEVRRLPGKVELVFDNYLDTSLLRLDLATLTLTTQCIANDGTVVTGGDGGLTWAKVFGPEAPRSIRAGSSPAVPLLPFVTAEPSDGSAPRGARLWRLAAVDNNVLVALAPLIQKAASKKARANADRILEFGWVPASEIE